MKFNIIACTVTVNFYKKNQQSSKFTSCYFSMVWACSCKYPCTCQFVRRNTGLLWSTSRSMLLEGSPYGLATLTFSLCLDTESAGTSISVHVSSNIISEVLSLCQTVFPNARHKKRNPKEKCRINCRNRKQGFGKLVKYPGLDFLSAFKTTENTKRAAQLN